VQKLILPKSSLMNIPIDVDAKLLIIPEKDVDEYDVMMLAEETCEMVRQLRIEAFIMHSFL
jgi:sodium/hydrogen exchanger 10/11